MKNKSTGTGERKKGFYTALVAGTGAVLVLALVISFSNLTITPPDQIDQIGDEPTADYLAAYDEEAQEVGAQYTTPYLAHAGEQALFRPRATPNPAATPPAPPMRQAPNEGPAPQPAPGAGADRPVETENAPPPPAETPAVPAETEAAEPAAETVPASEPAPTAPQASVTFEPFAEGGELMWPVYGDIAMIFSHDRLIFNTTLNQWRTNDDLRITAQEGTPVRASAAGKVVEVSQDRVYGNFVRIDNGDGWQTIFGQLMDNVLVAEGDIVQAGQVIGGVGRPSVFSVLDGHHVSLRVLRDDTLVDPKLLLADLGE